MSLVRTVYAYISGSWSDITEDVLLQNGISGSGGMASNEPTDRISRPGRLTFSLKNNDGKYTPTLAGSLTGWGKGTKVKVDFTHNTITRTKFIGYVDSVKISISNNNNVVANVTALSWMHYASQQPINNPPLQTNQRADSAIDAIVSAMPIQPEDTSYAIGTNTFPYIFHDASIKTRAYTEFAKIVQSEWCYIYDKADGTLVLESYTSRDTPTQNDITYYTERGGGFIKKSDGGYILKSDGGKIKLSQYYATTEPAEINDDFTDIDIAYGEHIINRVTVTAHPYKTGDEEILVYELDVPRAVAAGETTRFTVQFSDVATGRPISSLAPTTGTQETILHLDSYDVTDDAGLNTWTNNNADYFPSAGKFAGALFFDGGGSYISSPAANKFNLAGYDFTIEWWEYRTDEAVGCTPIARGTTGTYVPFALGVSDLTNAKVYMSSNGSSWDIANGKTLGTMIFDQWVHYAVTRNGSTFRTFQNGVQKDTWTSSASFPSTSAAFSIGRYNGVDFIGYLCEIRIVKGEAKYTGAFTPPIEPFKLSGTQYMVWTGEDTTGDDITGQVSMSISAGGAGINVVLNNTSGYDGILWPLKVHAIPVSPSQQETYSAEDDTSVLDYGYQQDSIEQRYQQDVDFGAAIADALVAAEKDPRVVLNSITTDTGRSEKLKTLFTQIDIGDVVSIVEPNTEKDALFYVQGVSWKAMPAQEGAHVNFKWILKEV